jgi:uncharacterized phage infection (PIP) family protein YhgE
VQRVTDIIGEISAAALEQSQGIGQVNEAVTRLDQMTQQNAALVEESAAAAESLKEQAHRMTTVVANYRIDGSAAEAASWSAAAKAQEQRPVAAALKAAASFKPAAKAGAKTPAKIPAKPAAYKPAVKSAAKSAAKPASAASRPAAAPAPATTTSGASDDWESF